MTVSFINALRGAFDKLYEGDKPDQIWIVFISVPYKDKGTYRHAEHLPQKIGQDETNMFKDEYIFSILLMADVTSARVYDPWHDVLEQERRSVTLRTKSSPSIHSCVMLITMLLNEMKLIHYNTGPTAQYLCTDVLYLLPKCVTIQ